MTAAIEIHTRPDVDLKGALVLIGTPGLGFVGSITARYLVEQLDMERIGGLHSPHFPPYVPVENGRPLHPVRIHFTETACGLDLDCDRLVVLTSELFPAPQMIHALADRLVTWANEIEAELVVVPDAIVQDDERSGDRVHGVASTDAAFGFLERSDVPPLHEAALLGLTASLMAASELNGVDMAAVLAGSQPDHPDARAAARLVAIMDKVLPGVSIEQEPLLKRAEEIETMVKGLRSQMAQQAAQTPQMEGTPQPLSMFH